MKEKYDVVIIGAGVGGLACGCYMAKEKLKILIVEQHYKPGGYCTSFERNGYRFDVGVHYLGGIKKRFLGKILEEIDLKEEIQFKQFDPTDKIIMPDNTTYIRKNPYNTIEEFKKSFPKEKKNIDKFFKFVMQKNFFNIYKKAKKSTFQEILDEFFKDYRIKATLEVLLCNFGISAKKASALVGLTLYRDYTLDGGYYPAYHGIQGFPDALADKFATYGGRLILGKKVEEILVKNGKIEGVELNNGKIIEAQYVVSNADATQTFKVLIKKGFCKENTSLKCMDVSPSLFAIYAGIDKNLQKFTDETCNMWHFDTYEVGKCISNLEKTITRQDLSYIMIDFPSAHAYDLRNSNKSTLQFFLLAPFKSEKFWDKYKNVLARKILKKIEKILPNLKKEIKIKAIATPQSFYKYTLNKNGACFGWLSNLGQTRASTFPQVTSIDKLFLVGHWCTIGSGQGGVSKAIFSGRRVANLILKKLDKKYNEFSNLNIY